MTPRDYSENALVEQPTLELLASLGWTVVNAFDESFGPGGTLGRDSMREVVLRYRLRKALDALNPDVPDVVLDEALTVMCKDRTVMNRVRANKEVYDLLRDGYRARWQDKRGGQKHATVRYVDFSCSSKNDWLAASQVWVAGELHRRRTDTVLFVNGIPLVLAEFKGPSRPVKAAYDENIRDYRDTIPQLFVSNAFVICSNGSEARVGSTYAAWDYFGDWKAIDAHGTRGVVALETAIRGMCAPDALLDLIENFVAYIERPGGLIKVTARNHQFLGVNAAIENFHRVRAAGEKRLGVFWHTQGSGKSLSMLWFTQKILRRVPGSWTFVMVTDRTELDRQLHGEFADAGAISPEAQVHASSATNLRELLSADHRYVFTLIQKFRLDKAAGETVMPILSERSDVVVITDEAHRSQYDTLALNMRRALPNAALMGFTGTPLIEGEELTRQQFGDYVSVYNFRDAIEDGATVPLYYENRIPELQLVNDNFADELAELLEQAELDDDAEAQLARRFGREYTLLTRPERLRTVARDLVEHFVGRGFTGKAMYVGLDKAAAVRMHDFVRVAWAEKLAALRVERGSLPEVERPWLNSRIELMETIDMAVVVSQSQNEIADLERTGLDIRPHRLRMNSEDLAERFKDPKDSLQLVFVCAMWMTGFDAPSVSTIYLDRPMRNHSLMQTIARANRVFPNKENGLIVDYVGVFRNLEKALSIYGSANVDDGVVSPIQDIGALVNALGKVVDIVVSMCSANGVDLVALRDASGFAHIALRDAAVEALLIDEATRTEFLSAAREAQQLFKALLPDPAAGTLQATVAAIRILAERIADVSRARRADVRSVSDAVDDLLDRSVGAEEYVIRAASEGSEPDPLIDLSQIDFDSLIARFAGRKRAETDRLATLLKSRATAAAKRNPTRYDLLERIEELIANYNAGSLNIDEYLRRLVEVSKTLSQEERRAADQGLTEEELAILDLLTKPEPELTEGEFEAVKASAKRLLPRLHDMLVFDWRRKAATTAAVHTAILDVLDGGLPDDPYPPALFDVKVQAIFDHVTMVYGDDGSSVYEGQEVERVSGGAGVATLTPPDLSSIADEIVERMRTDAELASLVAKQLGLAGGATLRTVEQVIENDEDCAVEFKSTARWDLREGKPNKAIEDAIVKTVAGFLNADGGTLLIGIGPDRQVVGLSHDYGRVKPANGDGFVNWLTTHLINAIGHTPVTRTRARIVVHQSTEICRLDVAPSTQPVWAKTSKADGVFYVRINNSTRALPDGEAEQYRCDHWPGTVAVPQH
ncbi:HsdR family type I site-specific deoxyribonuclease [Rhodococcus opacus]|uniref:HsdR family type I site-specific deoxyribonuclease n=1 Tax=Rhodococcus opacus TaxID=37919 RepID=UPI00223554E7|nr:HsdR family type I site-specific deoxyribonuclease [Rhodococcus opacus]UZG56243.1 HsdR family type I site-specific deoxyribonuclease [Rhodococcus opacus]